MKKVPTSKFNDLDGEDDSIDKPSNRLTKRLLAVENDDENRENSMRRSKRMSKKGKRSMLASSMISNDGANNYIPMAD
jgi:hypothetical protein